MASLEEIDAKRDSDAYEDAVLARHLARRPRLDTPAKQLAFARRELADHYAKKDRWHMSYQPHKSDTSSRGHLRWTNRYDWTMRERAWRRLIVKLTKAAK